MRIYVDGSSVYLNSSSSLDTYVAMSAGGHSVVVQAWDSSGAVFKSTQTLSVSASSDGVAVSSPGNNSTVGSPIHVVASASAPNPVAAMRVYLDGVSAFTVNAASLDTQVSAATGTHSLVVQAWDTTGAVYKQILTVTVGSGSTSSTVPANATVKTD